jgi:YD repeat-containing protein
MFYPDLSPQVLREYDLADAQTGCVSSSPQGRLSRVTDASGSTTYCYDRRGNVTRKIRLKPGETLFSGDARELHYAYYKDDQLRQIVYPHGAIVTYTRNSNGQATGLSWQPHAGGPVSALILGASYYPFGPLRAITFGNAQQLIKTYDSNYAIDSIGSQQPGGLVLDLQTDVFGNVTAVAPTLDGPVSRRYAYDPLNRLTEMRDGASQLLEQFSYSPVGDRLSKKIGTQAAQSYAYQPGNHRLGSIAAATRSYDANGNTTAGLGISSSPLVYDDTNRLSRVTVAGQGAT